MNTLADRLKARRDEMGWSQDELANRVHVSQGTIGNLESGIRKQPRNLVALAEALGVTPKWLETGVPPKYPDQREPTSHVVNETVRPYQPDTDPDDLTITQYDTGGAMGHGFALTDNPPGIIRSWRVSHDWLRLNVPVHTGLHNLAIVTGFGPSMRGMFNPGDPLLVDCGVKVVDHDGVYFFRVGGEGYIKIIQRVPEFDGPGIRLRILSKNDDYPPWDISAKHPDFEVLAKVLTVWKSEQY